MKPVPWWLIPVAVSPRWWPLLIALVLAAAVLMRWTRRTRRPQSIDEEVDLLGRLTAVGMAGGLSLPAALGDAARDVHPSVAAEVASVLRRASVSGLAVALTQAPQGEASDLLHRLAGAQVSGASPVAAVLAFVDERRAERRNRLLSRVRALPVLLSIPVALALLPGFVLVVVGPTVVERAGSLVEPLLGP